MASWDIFHADRLELERAAAQAIRSALARGDLRDDDLVRPAGTIDSLGRIADIPELIASSPAGQPRNLGPRRAAHPQTSSPRMCSPDFEEVQPSMTKSSRPQNPRSHRAARIVVAF